MTEDLNHCSTRKFNDDFLNFNERFDQKYGSRGYILDSFNRVMPGPTNKTVDFGTLFSVLKSEDASLLEEHAWIFEGECKYLDKETSSNVESMGQIVSYMSFPRCGNSFLRKYF